MKKVIYISGAISGLPREEYMKRFADAEQKLIKQGYKVLTLQNYCHQDIYGCIGLLGTN